MSRLHNVCGQASVCDVWLDSLTEFKWDKVYFFDEYYDSSNIFRDLKIRHEYKYERSEKTIFVKNDSIVFLYEKPLRWLSALEPNDYFIYFPKDVCAMQFTPKNAYFAIITIKNTEYLNVRLVFVPIKNQSFKFHKWDDSSFYFSSDSITPPTFDKLDYQYHNVK